LQKFRNSFHFSVLREMVGRAYPTILTTPKLEDSLGGATHSSLHISEYLHNLFLSGFVAGEGYEADEHAGFFFESSVFGFGDE